MEWGKKCHLKSNQEKQPFSWKNLSARTLSEWQKLARKNYLSPMLWVDGWQKRDKGPSYIHQIKTVSWGTVAEVTNDKFSSSLWGISRTQIFFFFKEHGPFEFEPLAPPWLLIMTHFPNLFKHFVLGRICTTNCSFIFNLGSARSQMEAGICAKVWKCQDSGGCKSHFTFGSIRKPRAGRNDSIWSPVAAWGFEAYC